MNTKRKILFRVGAVLALLIIAAVMMLIGRGHTLYFDNKTYEAADGQTYPAAYKAVVYVNGENVAELFKRERGMATWIGQNFHMELEITAKKGEEPVRHSVSIQLPYSVDGIIVNMPAYLAGLTPQEYLSEFVPLVTEEEETEEIVTDEFAVPSDI